MKVVFLPLATRYPDASLLMNVVSPPFAIAFFGEHAGGGFIDEDGAFIARNAIPERGLVHENGLPGVCCDPVTGRGLVNGPGGRNSRIDGGDIRIVGRKS